MSIAALAVVALIVLPAYIVPPRCRLRLPMAMLAIVVRRQGHHVIDPTAAGVLSTSPSLAGCSS